MREFAEKGDFEGFKDGVPSKGKNLAKKLYDDIRKGMGINEGTLPQYMIEDLITEGVYDPEDLQMCSLWVREEVNLQL